MNRSDKGLLLDLDGTLADSLAALKATYFSFLQAHGSKGTAEEFETFNGMPLPAIIKRLRTTYRLPVPPGALLDHYVMLVQQAQESAQPSVGALSVLKRSHSRGWRVAVVTSTPRRLALGWLDRCGLNAMVDAVVGGDDVRCGKPSAEPYKRALDLLQCRGAQSLAVEDSPLGARAAVSAGIPTLAIAHSSRRGEWPSEVRFIKKFADIADHL